MGRVIAAVLLLLLLAAAPAAAADALCARFTIPPELGLACTPEPGSTDAVRIAPVGGEFAALSELTVRELDPAQDPLAWREPERWLREQLSVDMSGLEGALGGLTTSPDSPFAGAEARSALGALEQLLDRLGRLPLEGCGAVDMLAGGTAELACRYGVGTTGLFVTQRLVPAREQRYVITMRTMNQQRLRHFEAIANSFTPAAL